IAAPQDRRRSIFDSTGEERFLSGLLRGLHVYQPSRNAGDVRRHGWHQAPIYTTQKQRPALTEANASFESEKRSLENKTTVLMFKIRDKYLAETTAQRLVKLYSTTIVPQSSLSLESAIAGYEVGKVDFLTLLDNLVTLLNYELSYYEQLSNEEKAVAGLEPLVGVTLRP